MTGQLQLMVKGEGLVWVLLSPTLVSSQWLKYKFIGTGTVI